MNLCYLGQKKMTRLSLRQRETLYLERDRGYPLAEKKDVASVPSEEEEMPATGESPPRAAATKSSYPPAVAKPELPPPGF